MKRNPITLTGTLFVSAWMGTGLALAQSPDTIHPDASGSKGASRSERTGESDVPLPKGSPSAGTVEAGKSGNINSGNAESRDSAGTINPNPNASLGSSQSERDRETGVPLPKGSRSAGTVELGEGHRSTADIKQAQQALKDKGYDPGAVDGVMGARTKEAIKSFQNASSLQVTGTLDAATAQQLGVSSGNGVTKTTDDMRSNGNTTRGKDSDQPNLPPQSK